MIELSTIVDKDSILEEIILPFDYSFDGTSKYILPDFKAPLRDGTWSIGLIVGSSGSGKTQLLSRNYGITQEPTWEHNKAICSQLGDSKESIEKLTGVGLSDVPSWVKPYHVLSNGQQFRARMAKSIGDNTSFDEFTSVVDRNVAKSCSNAINRYIHNKGLKGVVFSSCHYDIIEYLRPDWIFDTLTGNLSFPRGCLQRPQIELQISRCETNCWRIFRDHHYLSGDINKACRSWVAIWDGAIVGFVSVLPMPSGTLKNAWREHRLCVLPDYRGLGIGVKISNAVGDIMLGKGYRYYSKTSHPILGEYRNSHPEIWRATGKNGWKRPEKYSSNKGIKGMNDKMRINTLSYSHEYINNSKV